MDPQKRNSIAVTVLGLIACAAILWGGCLGKFQMGRIAVSTGRMATIVVKTSVETSVAAKLRKCAEPICKAKHPGDAAGAARCVTNRAALKDPAYLACKHPAKPAEDFLEKGVPIIDAGWTAADAYLNMAEKLAAEGQATDWALLIHPVQRTACLLSKGLKLLEQKTRDKVEFLIKLMGEWGCVGTPVTPAPSPARP